MAESVNPPEINPAPFEFKTTPTVSLCTSLTCSNSHVWAAEVQMTQCPGCKSPILAIKMVNCPQCNEPSTALVVRADHLSRGQAITPICRGSASLAEVHKITIPLAHSAQEQATHIIRQLPEKL